MTLLALNGSHSASSRTHALAARAVALHGSGSVVDLCTLDPAGLLGVGADDGVAAVIEQVAAASVLVLATPVYRATYAGVLKVLLDQLPQGALRGKACILGATGATPLHYLSLDTGLRAVVASLEGWSVPTVIYATPESIAADGTTSEDVDARLRAALAEAGRVVG